MYQQKLVIFFNGFFLKNHPQFYWIEILTNGTLITEQDTEKLVNYEKLKEVQVSLDGGTEYVHDLISGRGNFEKAIISIKLLKAKGRLTLKIE